MFPSSIRYKGVGHELCSGAWGISHELCSGVWGCVSPACLSSSLGPCTFALPQELSFLIGSAFLALTTWNPPPSAGTTTVLLNTLGSTLPPIMRRKNQSSPGRQAVLGFPSCLSFLRGSLWQLSASPGSPGRPGGVGEKLGCSQGREEGGISLLTHTCKQCNPLFWFP